MTDFNNKSKHEIALQETIENIRKLPPSEFSYYLLLFVAIIQNEAHPEKHTLLLASLNDLTKSIDDFYNDTPSERIADQLEQITLRLNTLIELTKTNTLPRKIQKIVLQLCGIVTSLIIGIIGGALGLTIGFFSQPNCIKGAWFGFPTGFVMGLIIGYRLPNTLFLDPFIAKMQFTFTSMQWIIQSLVNEDAAVEAEKPPLLSQNQYAQPAYNETQNYIKKYVIDTYYAAEEDKEAAFQNFLQSTQKFQVCTTQSGFLDRSLKGSIGNHTLIRYKINDIKDTPLEFGARKRTPNWVDQAETERCVSGQKLFEMLVLDQQLQKTHAMNLQFALGPYQSCDNDCLTYIDKILIGTQQAPTQVKRFEPKTDTLIGTKLVAPLFRFFSTTSERELAVLACQAEENTPLEVSTFTRDNTLGPVVF